MQIHLRCLFGKSFQVKYYYYEFGKKHDRSLWCYGNHDVSYLWDAMESGYSIQARITDIEGITKLENVIGDRYRFVHRIDDVLFSHGGLTEK